MMTMGVLTTEEHGRGSAYHPVRNDRYERDMKVIPLPRPWATGSRSAACRRRVGAQPGTA
jgi:hypothetical protein